MTYTGELIIIRDCRQIYKVDCASATYYHNDRDCILNLEDRHQKKKFFERHFSDFNVSYIGLTCDRATAMSSLALGCRHADPVPVTRAPRIEMKGGVENGVLTTSNAHTACIRVSVYIYDMVTGNWTNDRIETGDSAVIEDDVHYDMDMRAPNVVLTVKKVCSSKHSVSYCNEDFTHMEYDIINGKKDEMVKRIEDLKTASEIPTTTVNSDAEPSTTVAEQKPQPLRQTPPTEAETTTAGTESSTISWMLLAVCLVVPTLGMPGFGQNRNM